MKTFKLLTCAGALTGLGALAMAHAGSPADYFKKYDANADGVVTEAEFVAVKTAGGKVTAADAQAKFAKLAGTDGQMTMAELESAMKVSAEKKKKEDCSKSKDRAA